MYQVKLSIFYIIIIIKFILTYSYNILKSNDNGNILSTNTDSNNIRDYFKNINNNDLTIDSKKEKNNIKIRKNVNKLYNNLFPNELEDQNKNNNLYKKYEMKQDGDNAYGTNVLSYEKDLNYEESNKKSDTLKNTKLFNTDMKTEYIKNTDETTLNKQSALGIFGNSEKMKSESKFAIFNYLKDFFKNSSYMRNFRNFIELFFNKYDQRIMESAVFFNFDETLF